MGKKKKDDVWMPGEEVELDQEYIVLAIPAAALEVKIEARVYHDGEVRTVSTTLGYKEVRDAIKEAQDGYIPGDALFSLTPLGEEYVKKLKERYSGDECI